ncbi:p53 and DNA damage-regulated protein 1-like isoform X2 [Halichondria panicea]|uniref:p53 and DNA damage-regulated protein 1-like isoform X2 n=1 Tax=Halichondria panicea TaxID=6063 RepID=UPI00312B4CEB
MEVHKQVDELIKEYAAVDAVAVDIISDKHQMVDLDAKRNKTREALRQLKSTHSSAKKEASKSWVCFGNTFIKMHTTECVQLLEKDQTLLTSEIDEIQRGLKPKVAELNKMEGRAELKGFELKGMNIEEMLSAGGQ